MSKIIYAESFTMDTGFGYMANAINAAHSSARMRYQCARPEIIGHPDIDELTVRRNSDGTFHVNFKVFEHDTQGAQAATGNRAGEG